MHDVKYILVIAQSNNERKIERKKERRAKTRTKKEMLWCLILCNACNYNQCRSHIMKRVCGSAA